MIPRNHEYVNKLRHHLRSKGVTVVLLKPFHYSSLNNILKIIYHRIKGSRIIHVHWLYIFPHELVMRCFCVFAESMNMKIIWEVHNILPHGYKEIDRTISRTFFHRADGIVFHSHEDVGRIKDLLGVDSDKPYIVMPHGNFIGSYRNDTEKQAARSLLQIDPGAKVLLCFGFLRKNRGYDCLLDAVERIRNVILILAGRVEDKEVHRELVRRTKDQPNVRLYTGWIPNDDVQIYFNACDVVVLPYSEITTSGVAPLAYSFKRPVITTSIGGMKEIVTEETGMIVPPKDPRALAAAIESVLKKDYVGMGENAYRFAVEKLDWGKNVEKLIAFYGAVMSLRAKRTGNGPCRR